ncbi:TPA: PorV/PorQ family protein, partial [bacterium]|nr:PorV/PorQ family protein [bacterium]
GMGGAFVAVADDGTTTYWSPGGLPNLKSRELSFMYCQQFNSLIKTNFISYVHPETKWGSFGISWLRLGVEDIPKTGYKDINQNNVQDFDDKNENGIKDPGELYIEHPIQVGSFDDIEDGIFFTYGLKLSDEFSTGVNIKYIKQSLASNTSTGIGFDLGAVYQIFDSLKVGVNLQDLTKTKLKWDSMSKHEDIIPMSIKFGAAYSKPIQALKSDLTLSWSLDTKYGTEMRYGVEWWLLNVLAVRIGMNVDELSAGAGLRLSAFQVDYAFIGHDDLGNTHRISTSVKF